MTVALPSVPALIALVLKVLLLGYALRSPSRGRTTALFFVLLLTFSIQNLVEFLGLNEFARAEYSHVELYGRLYFATVILFLALLLHLSLRISYDPPALQKLDQFTYLIYAPAVILGLLLFGDRLVAGFKPFQYSILRQPGPYYFFFETYATIYMLMALTSLGYGARHTRSSLSRTRNRLWLYGLLPIALLVVYLIVANHFGRARITSTFYLPLAITLFLGITAYATHQYRLFDIEFYFPWSKVRKRKTVFYERLQATVAEIADMKSVREILDIVAALIHCQVALIGGPRPMAAFVNGQKMRGKETLLLADFPREALRDVDTIVVANEIADSRPDLYQLMKQHKVGAIMPFKSHSAASANWMLFGEHFSDQIYTPLDFKRVEQLFNSIAERFLDGFLLLRSQLADAQEEIREYRRRLRMASGDIEEARDKLAKQETANRTLRAEKAELRRRNFRVVDSALPKEIASGQKTLAQYMAEFERDVISQALHRCGGDRKEAARRLGIRPRTLRYLIERHNLESEKSG